MECTCHKGIVIRCITEHNQFCTTQGIIFLGILSGFLHHLSHKLDRIHIDACLGGAQVHRAAHTLCGGQRKRNGTDQQLVCRSHSLAYQCRISAKEIHTHFMCYFIQGLCNACEILDGVACGAADQRNGRYGNSLIYNRNTKFSGDLLSGLHQILGCFVNFVINFIV